MQAIPALLLFTSVLAPHARSPQVELRGIRGAKRILFLGDSITYSGGFVESIEAYFHLHCPGKHVELINAGLPSETVSGLTEPNHAGGEFPRPDLHERLARALAKAEPDLVVACYGMNDGIYHPFDETRFAKFKSGMQWLKDSVQKSGARLWLLTPPPFDPEPVRADLWPAGRESYPSGHTFEGYDAVLSRYSTWLIEQKWPCIDIHTPINAYLSKRRHIEPGFRLADDGVHINGIGHMLIAREILRSWGAPEDTLPPIEQPSLPVREGSLWSAFNDAIHLRQNALRDAWLYEIGHLRPGMPTAPPIAMVQAKAMETDSHIHEILEKMPPVFPGVRSDYHGFDRFDFDADGIQAIVVSPKEVSPTSSLPWIWRAEFFDHRPELDLALLARGFHLVYIEVGNTFGAPTAMAHWDTFYNLLTKRYRLSAKPVLEGLSRGGLYVYNWAARHPKHVSVLYGDNPVCDFKSWPGGKGAGPGSADDWKKLQTDYGFRSESAAMAYKLNPIDNLAPLAKAHVPIIHCAADADEVVPYEENTAIVKKRYEAMGGRMEVIVKHGFKHHPHGLDDPAPLVEFILAHTKS